MPVDRLLSDKAEDALAEKRKRFKQLGGNIKTEGIIRRKEENLVTLYQKLSIAEEKKRRYSLPIRYDVYFEEGWDFIVYFDRMNLLKFGILKDDMLKTLKSNGISFANAKKVVVEKKVKS